jgi:hypothetical protein
MRVHHRRRRLLACHLLALLAAATVLGSVGAPRAAADADPASDILLGSPVFYPFQPAVSAPLQRELEHELALLRAKGLNLKVAIIASPIDLGAIPNMFGKPQTYAEFLQREISFSQPQPLLVVMPAGFGVAHAGPPGALTGLKVDTAQQSSGLARSASLAVQRIARASGKPIAAGSPASSTGSSGGGTSPLITFGGPAVLVVVAAMAVVLVRRRASALGGGDHRDNA